MIDLAPFLKEKSGHIVERGQGAIPDEYNVLHFDEALIGNDDLSVELEFEADSLEGRKLHRHEFRVPGYEMKRRSLYFWDVMSSA